MRQQSLPLLSAVPGTARAVEVWRFGADGARPRVYLQAGLHADEVPGMLVLAHLREQLQKLEAEGKIAGEILLVPMANPVGVAQFQHAIPQGRFDAASGINFNRGYPDPGPALAKSFERPLGPADVEEVRARLGALLAAQAVNNELDSLRHTLFSLACECDVVLDLHCDSEAALHLYVHSQQQDEARALAGFLGADATLHAEEQGGQSFDESCTRPWWWLRRTHPALPLACFAATVELRGQSDVSDAQAEDDARRLTDYLAWRGAIRGEARPPAPPAEPTPLSGVGISVAPHGGIVSYTQPVGTPVCEGEVLGWVVDPLSGARSALTAQTDGIYYARVMHRYTTAGNELCFVAGRSPLRSGMLLSA